MYVLFFNPASKEFFTVSRNSNDFPDFEAMVETGHIKKLTEGSRRVCEEFQDEHKNENLWQY